MYKWTRSAPTKIPLIYNQGWFTHLNDSWDEPPSSDSTDILMKQREYQTLSGYRRGLHHYLLFVAKLFKDRKQLDTWQAFLGIRCREASEDRAWELREAARKAKKLRKRTEQLHQGQCGTA